MYELSREAIERLREKGVVVLYLFGSRATGAARPDSDVDVAILTQHPLDVFEQSRIGDLISHELGVPEVDVISLDRAGLEMRGKVVQTGTVLFSCDEAARVAFEVTTRAEYLDYRPTLDRLTRDYIRRVAREGFSG